MSDMNQSSPPDTVLTLADRLKWARERKEWSQPHLAVAAGVSTSTVGMVESGARQNKGSLPQIATALGVRHLWLLHGELPVEADPLPAHYAGLTGEMPTGLTAVPQAPVKAPSAAVLTPEAEQRLARFLRALHQVPKDRQVSALLIATEVLLDHLPPAPSE